MNKTPASWPTLYPLQIGQLTSARMVEWVITTSFILLLVHSLWALTVGWWNPLVDLHHFRQTQTAISSYYLLQGGSWLAYETPVLGAPWSIPFEFPLYQWSVAAIAYLFNTPLDQTGRFVSIVYFYLSLLCVYLLLRQYQISRNHCLMILSLLLVSPLYLFWSRTFLIESTALFFGLLYLYFVVKALSNRKLIYFFLAAVAGVLAGLAKVTTFIGIGYLAATVVFHQWYVNHKGHSLKETFRTYLLPFFSFAVVPLSIASIWVKFTDAVKSENPLADFILSSTLKPWNFGSLEQRFSAELWVDTIANRIIPDLFGHVAWLIILCGLLVWGFARRLPEAKFASVLIAAFLLVLLTFTNLHIKHYLYSYANGMFLICAMGILLVSQLKSGKNGVYIGLISFVALIISSFHFYSGHYLEQHQKRDLSHVPVVNVANIVKTFTNPQDVILIYGYNWNSAIAYYSERRAIMDNVLRPIESEEMQKALENIKPQAIGAVLFCLESMALSDISVSNLRKLGFQESPAYNGPLCDVYLPQNKVTSTHFLEKNDWGGQGKWSYKEQKDIQKNQSETIYTLSSFSEKDANVSLLESAIFPLANLKVISVPILVGSSSGIEIAVVDAATQKVLVSLDTGRLGAAWFNWHILGEQLPGNGGAKLIIKDTGTLADEWVTIAPPKFVYIQQ